MGPPPGTQPRPAREGDSGRYRESPGTHAGTAPVVPRPSPGSEIATCSLVQYLSRILPLCFLLSRGSVNACLTNNCPLRTINTLQKGVVPQRLPHRLDSDHLIRSSLLLSPTRPISSCV